jgi:DNA-binding CsgD family transcriptional regulator
METARSQAAPDFRTPDLRTPDFRTPDFSILRAALENLPDGFIIVNQSGEIEKINSLAQHICTLLKAQANCLPVEIWQICQSALKNQALLSLQKIGLDAKVTLPNLNAVRVRVQNISFAQMPYLLVVLEDCEQSIRSKALSDAALFGLTEREADVWLLRLQGADYNDISTTLWISPNTVKKHVKNILAKQRNHLSTLETDETVVLIA